MRMGMKKLLSILLVTAMLASMAVTAFGDTNVTAPNGDIMVMGITEGQTVGVSGIDADAPDTGVLANQTVTFTNLDDSENGYTLKANITNGSGDPVNDVKFKTADSPNGVDMSSTGVTLTKGDSGHTATFTAIEFPANDGTDYYL